jgi:hypothetical protein
MAPHLLLQVPQQLTQVEVEGLLTLRLLPELAVQAVQAAAALAAL